MSKCYAVQHSNQMVCERCYQAWDVNDVCEPECDPAVCIDMSAIELLEKASGHLKDRADTYDKPGGERSIGATVAAFNAVTGDGLMNSEERGWLFMSILKMVRSQQGSYKADNYEDLAAYSALMGEAACEERNGGWTPEAIEAAAFRKSCDSAEVEWPDESRIDAIGQNGNDGAVYSEYTLQEVVGDAVLSSWVRWVVVTNCGLVVFASHKPESYIDSDQWIFTGRYGLLKKVVPPLNFKNCIWEVNVKSDCEYTLDQVIGDA